MEPHRQLSGIEQYQPSLEDGPKAYFEKALVFARTFYGAEMEQIGSVKFEEVTPEYFFREYVWVVHATGFSAKAVGKFMPRLLKAYGPWAILSGESFDEAFERIRLVCNNPQKSKAVWQTAGFLKSSMLMKPWEEVRSNHLDTPKKLSELPYIGKITCFHLGRNIGLLDCVKPDLHLIRMASYWGFKDCESMCRDVQPDGMPLGIVDLVFWYAASTFGTLSIKKDGER